MYEIISNKETYFININDIHSYEIKYLVGNGGYSSKITIYYKSISTIINIVCSDYECDKFKIMMSDKTYLPSIDNLKEIDELKLDLVKRSK